MTHRTSIHFYSTVTTALPSKRLNLTNMTANKANAIPEELISCTLKTIEERYPANEWLHIYTDAWLLPFKNQYSRCEIVLSAVRGLIGHGKENTTNCDGDVLAVYETIMHLLSAGLAPAKFVFFIDSRGVCAPGKSRNSGDFELRYPEIPGIVVQKEVEIIMNYLF
ncbi:reverse transcriptase [Trichonephila clavipes]|nr:reverse transcriptase [Trichonephila clavipes]